MILSIGATSRKDHARLPIEFGLTLTKTFVKLENRINFNKAAASDFSSGFGPVGRLLELAFWSVL